MTAPAGGSEAGPARARRRNPIGRLRRARAGGMSTVMRLVMRVPGRVRRPLAGPVAALLEGLAARRPRARRVPGLAFVARRAAGPAGRAANFARRLGTAPSAHSAARRQLAVLALDAGMDDAALEIAATIGDDPDPMMEVLRSRLAFERGRYTEALELAHHAAATGARGAQPAEARARSHLAALAPGWLPDPGEGAPRLAAVRDQAVRGRVLHVVSVSLPHRLAGYTVRTQSVARCQREAGLDAHVAVRTGFPAQDSTEPRIDWVEGVPYHRVPPRDPVQGPDRTLTEVVRSAIPVLEELRPAVLQPASNYLQARIALALAGPLGIPVVYEVRGFWEESWTAHRGYDEAQAMDTDRYRMTRAAETEAMLAADAIVTLSEVMRQEIIDRGCAPDRVVVVPNAVEVERFQPLPRDDALAASLGIDRSTPVVGYISSLNAYEGIPYLLEAASRLRAGGQRLRVLLVGDGEDEAAIREAGERLGLDDGTLVMPGRVSHDQVMRYYSIIDVFVVPRTSHRVSRLVTPLKPYEAMALERALVVSDLPALREIVTPGETGLTFRAEDADDLARVLGELLDDPALRARLGRQAREWIVTERTWTQNGQRYRALFERLGVT